MNRFELMKMLEFVRGLDISTNPEPAAIFDPLIQGFNVWCIPSDHPGGDWKKIVDKFDSGAYKKRCEYVGCAFYYNEGNGWIGVTTDAYALGDHLPEYSKYATPRLIKANKLSIHNRPDDIEWVIEKVKWVFEQIGVPCPEIRVGEDD